MYEYNIGEGWQMALILQSQNTIDYMFSLLESMHVSLMFVCNVTKFYLNLHKACYDHLLKVHKSRFSNHRKVSRTTGSTAGSSRTAARSARTPHQLPPGEGRRSAGAPQCCPDFQTPHPKGKSTKCSIWTSQQHCEPQSRTVL